MKYYLDAEVSTGWILRIVEEREAIVQIHILRKPETAEADMELRETALLLEAKRQLEEYFDLPQEDIQAALRYWTDSRGIDFTKQEADKCTLP